uniref:Uncharacterized protein n=1 Tax=viral metagenome TaxID=1070528 RepID=A0A6C0I2K6_9ZZZZ
MDPKYVSMLFLLGIIVVSLALSGYTFLVSNHSASIFGREGMTTNKLVGTPLSGGPVYLEAESSLMSAASYTTSGEPSGLKLEASQLALHSIIGNTVTLGGNSISTPGPTIAK